VIFEPFEFLARLAARVPLPPVHLTRYHGIFVPASELLSVAWLIEPPTLHSSGRQDTVTGRVRVRAGN
jgi:hypothetical protein